MTSLRLPLLAAAAALLIPALAACGAHPEAAAPIDAPAHRPTVLGPTGYGHLRIGMSYADALATGDVTDHHLTGRPDAEMCLSKKDGLMAIFAGKGMHTPEGIRVGSTARELRAAYPGVRSIGPDGSIDTGGIMRVDTTGGDWYEIDVNRRLQVTTIILRQDEQTCFE